jgi:hypothetical protein
MEIIGGLVMGLGGLIALIGWIWLMVVGFQQGGALWGILIFFFSWVAGLIFCIMHKTGWVPLVMMVIGGIVASVGMVPMMLSVMENMPAS